MTRHEIIRELVKRTDLTTSEATHAVEGVIDIITDALVKEEPVLLRGFAAIKTVRRAAKTARDIQRGTIVHVPPYKQVKFIAYSALKERINRKEE